MKDRKSYEKEWRKNNPDKVLGYKKDYREKHPDSQVTYREERMKREPDYERKLLIKLRYGLDYEHYERLLELQANACAICMETFERTPHVDHNHLTGEVRGLLCERCNTGLGAFRDNQGLLEMAGAYLEHYPYRLVNVTDESESATETKPPASAGKGEKSGVKAHSRPERVGG